MPSIPVATPLGYAGVFFVIAGIFLVIAGLDILKIEKLIATGRKTWVAGLLLTIIGVLFLMPDISAALNPTATPLPVPTTMVSPTGTPAQSIPKPELILSGTEEYEASGQHWVRYELAIANWTAFPPELFEPAPDLPPCGLNTSSSRTWVEIFNAKDDSYIYGFCALSSPESLTSIWFAVEKGAKPPETVYVVLMDRKNETAYRSNSISTR